MSKFYKTTYTVTVLSEGEPVHPHSDIGAVLEEMSDGGLIGDVEYTSAVEIPVSEIEAELVKVGNDGLFFDLDDEETPLLTLTREATRDDDA